MEELRMKIFMADTIRDIVTFVNNNNLLKDNIVSIIKGKDGYSLIYYK